MLSTTSQHDNIFTTCDNDCSDVKLLSPRSIYSNDWSLTTTDPISETTSLCLSDETNESNRSSWYQHESSIRKSQRSAVTSFSNTKKNYTFNDYQLRDIQRANINLMERLENVKRSTSTTAANTPQRSALVASATINRKKKEQEIHRTNSILMAKLEAIARKQRKAFTIWYMQINDFVIEIVLYSLFHRPAHNPIIE